MTNIVAETAIALVASPELSLLAKATATMALGLAAARLARRGRASVRHLVLVATFATLLALPVAALLMPAIVIAVPVAGSPAVSASARGETVATDRENAVDPRSTSVTPLSRWSRWSGWARSWSSPFRPTLLRVVWAAGTSLFLLSLAVALWRLRRIRRAGLPCLDLRELARPLAADAGVRGNIEIVAHEQIVAPLTYGLNQTTIVLPVDIDRWSVEEIRRALVHELEHARRGDWMVQLSVRIICALYWFHPLVWVAWRQLSLDAERACDDAVVRTAEGPEYAQQLVLLARRLSNASAPLTLSMANRSDLSARVTALLDARQRRGRAGVVFIGTAVAGAAVVVLTLAPLHAVAAPMRSRAVVTNPTSTFDSQRRATSRDRTLFRAAERGDLDRMVVLIDTGANVNAVLEGDGSPLIGAARAGKIGAVKLLLDRGADPNMGVDGDGNPLIMAAREGHLDIVVMLLDRGAQIDLVVPSDENALIQASAEGHLAVVTLLVARGADVNARVWADSYVIAADLTKMQASARPNGEWRTPLSMARKGRHNEVVAFLLSAGARE